jgi:hypothetical protein
MALNLVDQDYFDGALEAKGLSSSFLCVARFPSMMGRTNPGTPEIEHEICGVSSLVL